MATAILAGYIEFATSGVGIIVLTALSIGALALIVGWATRGRRGERLPVLVTATILSVFVVAFYAVEVRGGAWSGGYFSIPFVVQLLTLLAIVFAAWIAWFMGYGWLIGHRRHPLLIYTAVALCLVLAAAIADRMEVSGGLLLLAPNGVIWLDALLGVAMMFAPVLLFEAIRRGFGRDALP
jgi:hypothetical protein